MIYVNVLDRNEAASLIHQGFDCEIERDNFVYSFLFPVSDELVAARAAFRDNQDLQGYLKALAELKARMREV